MLTSTRNYLVDASQILSSQFELSYKFACIGWSKNHYRYLRF